MKQTVIWGLLGLVTMIQVQSVSACVIAVESNVEVTLLKEIYNLKSLKLTTQTKNADIGFKLVPELVKKTDPVFGEIKMNTTVNVRADIYERGLVIASTDFYPHTDFADRDNSPFAKDLKRILASIGCN